MTYIEHPSLRTEHASHVGVAAPATVLGQGETAHMRPIFLPDGRHFLYRAYTGSVAGPFYLASLDSSDRKLLLKADSQNVLYADGYLMFLHEHTLMAQPFDTRRFALTGEAFPIADQIQSTGNSPPYGVFSTSENGVLAFRLPSWNEALFLSAFAPGYGTRKAKESVLGGLGCSLKQSRLQLSVRKDWAGSALQQN